MSEAMDNRPPVSMITYISAEGNPHSIVVGCNGVTAIREVEEDGEYAAIPWVEVWAGPELRARFNQHKLEHIFYGVRCPIPNGGDAK